MLCISEHHSNLVPWQQVARLTGATLKYLYVDEAYRLPGDEVRTKITSNTKITAIAHMSNVLGTIYPVAEIAAWAHRQGAVVVVDAAQSVPHLTVDVESLDADFLVFSGHKVYGPTGIGVLYGRAELLERMAPYQHGGDMIEYVEEQSSTFAPVPQKFEAGTPTEGAVGSPLPLTTSTGLDWRVFSATNRSSQSTLEELKKLPWVTIYGSSGFI